MKHFITYTKKCIPHVVTLIYNLSVEIKQVDVDATHSTVLGTIYPDSDDQTAD